MGRSSVYVEAAMRLRTTAVLLAALLATLAGVYVVVRPIDQPLVGAVGTDAGAGAPAPDVATEAAPKGAVLVQSNDGEAFRLAQRLPGGEWWVVGLERQDAPGGYPLPQLTYSQTATWADGDLRTEVAIFSKSLHSAHEYAASVDVGRKSVWVGSVHGYERLDGIEVQVDGESSDLGSSSGEAAGESVTLIRKSRIVPPRSQGRTLATVTTMYTMTADGLTVDWEWRWTQDATVSGFYSAMLPADETFTEGRIGDEGGIDLTQGTNTAAGDVHLPTGSASMTNPASGVTATLEVVDLDEAVAGWATSGPSGLTWIEDREDNLLNKIYVTRVGGGAAPVEVGAADVWGATSLYSVAIR